MSSILTCLRKKPYRSRARARKGMINLQKYQRESRLNVYKCEHCDQFHVGHKVRSKNV